MISMARIGLYRSTMASSRSVMPTADYGTARDLMGGKVCRSLRANSSQSTGQSKMDAGDQRQLAEKCGHATDTTCVSDA